MWSFLLLVLGLKSPPKKICSQNPRTFLNLPLDSGPSGGIKGKPQADLPKSRSGFLRILLPSQLSTTTLHHFSSSVARVVYHRRKSTWNYRWNPRTPLPSSPATSWEKRGNNGVTFTVTNHISLHLSHSPVPIITGKCWARALLSSSIQNSVLPPVPHHLTPPPHRGLCPGLSHQGQCTILSGTNVECCLHHTMNCLGSWRYWDPQKLHSGPSRWPPMLPPSFMLPALILEVSLWCL